MTSKDTFDLEVDDLIRKRWNLRPKKSLKEQSNASPGSSSSQVKKVKDYNGPKTRIGEKK